MTALVAMRAGALALVVQVEREHARRALARMGHRERVRGRGWRDRWRDARRHLRRARAASEALARLG